MTRSSRPFRRRASLAWSATLVALLLLGLCAANVPFYAGSRIGPIGAWRMEHARLTLRRLPFPSSQTFYIAVNTEGIRFRPDWRFAASNDWHVTVPLWLPLVIAAAIAAREWTRPRAPRPAACSCLHCGYARTGLEPAAKCPECGNLPEPAITPPG